VSLWLGLTYLDPIPSESYVLGVLLPRWGTLLLAGVAIAVFASRGRALALAVAACFFIPWGSSVNAQLLHHARTFFGVYEVWSERTLAGTFHLIVHGTTTHGVQGQGPLGDFPTSYYGADGPMGDMLRGIDDDGPIDMAVIGLGAGALALYGHPGWTITFFEMDPAMAAIAEDTKLFTCLERSQAEVSVVLGDGRLMLGGSDQLYDVIVLDAFSSDSVPVHLLTVEAIEVWLAHLRPGGRLVFNVSNDFLALGQILAAAAQDLGLVCAGTIDADLTDEQIQHLRYASAWVLIARSTTDVDPRRFENTWVWLKPEDHVRAWTDDFSSLLSAMK